MDDDLAVAADLAKRAVGIAEQVGDTEALVHSLNNLGTAQLLGGDEAGRGPLERSLTLAVEHRLTTDAGRAYINLACGLRLVGRPSEELAVAELGIEYSRDHGLEAWQRCLVGEAGQAKLALGQWDAAAESAAAMLDAPPDAVVAARFDALTVLGMVRARRGDPEFQPLLDEARDLALGDAPSELLAAAAATRAEVAWLEGRADHIAAETDEAYSRVQRSGFSGYVGELAVWRRRAGLRRGAPRSPTRGAPPARTFGASGSRSQDPPRTRLPVRRRPRASRNRRAGRAA